MCRYFKRVAGVGSGNYIYFWKSKGLSEENITPAATTDYSLTPKLSYFGTKQEQNSRELFKARQSYVYSRNNRKHIYYL